MARRTSRPTRSVRRSGPIGKPVPEHHRVVDVGRARDALLDHADRLEPDREPEPAAREAGRVRDLDRLLADPFGPRPRACRASPGRSSGPRTSSTSWDAGTGLKKCIPTKPLAVARARGQRRDRDRARVRRDDRLAARRPPRSPASTRCLSAASSGTASTTSAAPASAPRSGDGERCEHGAGVGDVPALLGPRAATPRSPPRPRRRGRRRPRPRRPPHPLSRTRARSRPPWSRRRRRRSVPRARPRAVMLRTFMTDRKWSVK